MSQLSALLDRNGISPTSIADTLDKASAYMQWVPVFGAPLAGIAKGISGLSGIRDALGGVLGGVFDLFNPRQERMSRLTSVTLITGDIIQF